jgi:hypothetical protein
MWTLLLIGLATVASVARPVRQARMAHTCVRYWSDTVTVAGKVRRHVYPGPPNYESIRRGDEPQPVLLLRLDVPLCTRASKEYTAYEDVREVQILADPLDFRFAERHLGKRVRVRGTLTGADVGYHHRDVLIDATDKERQIALAR